MLNDRRGIRASRGCRHGEQTAATGKATPGAINGYPLRNGAYNVETLTVRTGVHMADAADGRYQQQAPEETDVVVLGAGHNGLVTRSEEHTSELQSRFDLVCRLLLEKKKI